MRKSLIALILCMVIGSSLIAQELKVAYIDTDRIMAESEATKEAQSIFMTERESWERELDEIEAEIERLQNEYEARKLTLTESGRTQAEERIEVKIRERRQFIENIFGEGGVAMQRNAELLEPIMDKLRDAIDRIADDGQYSIIFDAVGGGILYAKPNLDITGIVVEEMNKQIGTE
jgi:outer membrane protein